MEQINTFIQQARQQGQTDEQIRQSLLASGWNIEQVNAALISNNPQVSQAFSSPLNQPPFATPAQNVGQPNFSTLAPVQNVSKRKKISLPLVLTVIVLLLLIVGGSTFALLSHTTNYQSVIQQFVTAIENKNKTTADTLESPAFKTTAEKYYKTDSFYSVCKQTGDLCTPLFTPQFLNKATKTYKDYTATNGTKGKEVIYSLKQAASGTQAGGKGCSYNTKSTLTIAVVPHGNSWLVDSANPSIISGGTINLCPSPGVSTSTSTATTTSTQPANPYAGWSTYTLKQEDITFKYPSTWALKDMSDSNDDYEILSGSNDFQMTVGAGAAVSAVNAPEGGDTVVQADSVTFAGQPAFLDLWTDEGAGSNSIYSIWLSQSSTQAGDFFPSKNITFNAPNSRVVALIDYNAPNAAHFTNEPLSYVENDINYKDAKLIIDSMSY
jgi:hypothetical protein